MPSTKPVDALLAELRETLKAELREEVRAELIAELSGGKGAGKPSPKAAKSPAPKTASSKPLSEAHSAALKVTPGKRRTADEVAEAAAALIAHIRKNPGARVDQISAAVGVPVKDLQLPIAFLLEHKKVKKAGKLRGTTYTAKG